MYFAEIYRKCWSWDKELIPWLTFGNDPDSRRTLTFDLPRPRGFDHKATADMLCNLVLLQPKYTIRLLFNHDKYFQVEQPALIRIRILILFPWEMKTTAIFLLPSLKGILVLWNNMWGNELVWPRCALSGCFSPYIFYKARTRNILVFDVPSTTLSLFVHVMCAQWEAHFIGF